MLREYIIGEAMHAFGIPTTRALAVVSTGEDVIRERVLPGAVLVRVADSHVRVGTFRVFRRSRQNERGSPTSPTMWIPRAQSPNLVGRPDRFCPYCER